MFKRLSALLTCLTISVITHAQETFPQNGAYDERSGRYAFTNANIVVDSKTTILKGTMLIENGIIREVGKQVKIPAGTVVMDLKEKYIYPSLIDLDSDYGMPDVKRERAAGGRQTPQLESNKKGAFGWNQAIQPENDASLIFTPDAKKAEELRKIGFGTVLIHSHDGIVRGNGAVVTLTDEAANKALLKRKASAHFSFSKGSSSQTYPSSTMGVVALLRQNYYDADWYAKTEKVKENNLSLEAFNQIKTLPSFFETNDKYSIIRADKVGDEFGIQYIIKGGGDEYQRLKEIKATKATLILPLQFPEAYDVADPWDADLVSVAQLKHWEMAPKNPAEVAKAEIPFAFTVSGMKNKADFWKNIKTAIEYGLPKEKALEALTTIPASLIKAEGQVGSLKRGLLANFIITSGDLFGKDNVIYENWIQGKQFVLSAMNAPDVRGTYALSVNNQPAGKLQITGALDKPEYKISVQDSVKITPKVILSDKLLTMTYQADKNAGTTRLTGWLTGTNLYGEGVLPNGNVVSWSATLSEKYQPAVIKDSTVAKVKETGPVYYPFVGFGNETLPVAETVLIRNATIWTNEKEGILQNADVLVQNGKITKVGKSLSAPSGAKTIDGTGKHLTSGIIDEHSHIALFTINEGGQTSSAEVRMSDVINPDDVNIYRQLAGGVTTSHLLHGSANSIGGQSALIKLKWGASQSEMLIPEVKTIKFALGENVKQSNWGDIVRTRFPQTRMGVEQVFFDHFLRAKDYAAQWKAYNANSKKQAGNAPRRDIELDALAEILASERFITCHSYVQSEINMLMHVADSLNFKINTFTHILEGYKLADKMAKRGIGGSTFGDWWAYKMEVKEAIPYNAALMYHEGVMVAINSDDAEMARRLNQEAAKTVEYGGVPEEEAWKMVTLNPAKLLHVDNRLGSVRVGKDADLVLWNAHPLSIYARPEFTMIEGAVYFDRKKDEEKQKTMAVERERLIQKMLGDKAEGKPTQKPQATQPKMWHCEDIVGVHTEHETAH
ncbi:amidohydrolase family protein [Dyadobacter fanqingshengii]|uniref:Amidohydrolase family protein n=1 Tax=Dyadobacter fanqingshengii TaxID=2906443 RepID=A0A9X1T8E2_9BACT|nr:amidohydrolase family protein [Dyadobacter fanqingshengii]MCF0039606.1 amidohydrolase family protein [Dyadobacter fanqingshengii]USJ38626.1 amidohydrolase family protein [Dyadobacter fanqingshengii]